jgi:general secretion pathway protein A
MFDDPLYEAFYGLHHQPFALSTDPRFLFLSGSHRQVYDELLMALRRREGLVLLTGETGTGKTTVCRAVMEALGPRSFGALILNPYMSDAEVVRVILREFGLVSRDEIRRGALSKAETPELIDTLEGFLLSLLPLESYAVVVLDEAQSLTPRVLDQVRVLGDLEHNGQRLLQIVLAGQPDLNETVRIEPLRALNERITRRMTLNPLNPREVDAYIRHRLVVAGGEDSVEFQPDATALIAERSAGLPRRINLLCDRALEEGRTAGTMQIDANLVRRAANAIAGGHSEDFRGESVRPEFNLTELDSAAGRAAPVERDVTLTFGQPAATETRGRNGLLWLALLILVVLSVAGGYAWVIGSQPVELPPTPDLKLKVGAPPAVLPPPPPDEPPRQRPVQPPGGGQ